MHWWYRHIVAGALGGLGSSLLATILEISAFPPGNLGLQVALVVLGTVATHFVAAGAVLGAALATLRAAGRALARVLRSRHEDVVTSAILAALAAPVIALLLREMARGHKAAELLGPVWVRVLLTIALTLAAGGACRLGLWVGRRAIASHGRLLPLGLGLGLLAGAQVLFQADAHLYQRLYQYLHLVLLGGYLLAGVLGSVALWRGVFPAGRPPLRRWLRAALAGALLASLIGGTLLSRRALIVDQHLRYCVLELSVVASKLISLLPLEVRSESPLFLDSALSSAGSQKGKSKRHVVANANVVMVSIDALRPDHLGTYGYGRPTSPNIDALAAKAVRFESAYCPIPLTCYSVPSLHTGDYLRSTLPLLPKPPPPLARILSGRGYTTAAFYNSSMFFCDDEKATSYGQIHFGFDYAETTHREAEPLTDQVLSYLQQFQRAGKRKLFLWVHYFDVHEPYRARAAFPFGPNDVDRYDAGIGHVDLSIGRLLAAVSELPGPTIFILTSDHGEEFKEHGGYYHGSSLYEEQVRVPLIIGVPGVKPAVVKAPVELVDVVPTVLGLLGERIPETVRGRSLVPALLGSGDDDRPAFAEIYSKKMVRQGRWKLIHDFRRSTNELYDLESDPRERSNLVSRRTAELTRLQKLLGRWFDQIRSVATAVDKDRPEAIDLGRIGDRRALPQLAALLLDREQASRWRQEAARLIGQLQDRSVAEQLWMAVGDDDQQVAAEAAIALGEVKDPRARVVLPSVLTTTDIDLRMRAGVALGRVDSPAATPALVQALYSSNWEVQNRAAHYLGFVGDRRAVGPLLRAAVYWHLRPRLGLALGRIGARLKDRRIYPVLLGWAEHDPHAETRLRALAGLSFLGDRRAIRPLARLLVEAPDLLWVPETLSRLGGLGSWWAPGLDFTPPRRGLKEGWGECVNTTSMLSDEYHEASWCVTSAPVAGLQLTLGRKPFAAQLLIRVRVMDPRLRGRPVTVTVNGRELPSVKLVGSWQTLRLSTEARLWRQGRNALRFAVQTPAGYTAPAGGLLAFDHLLLVPERGSAP